MLELTNILKRILSPEVSRIRTSSFMKICKDVTETDCKQKSERANPDFCARCVYVPACVCVCVCVCV